MAAAMSALTTSIHFSVEPQRHVFAVESVVAFEAANPAYQNDDNNDNDDEGKEGVEYYYRKRGTFKKELASLSSGRENDGPAFKDLMGAATKTGEARKKPARSSTAPSKHQPLAVQKERAATSVRPPVSASGAVTDTGSAATNHGPSEKQTSRYIDFHLMAYVVQGTPCGPALPVLVVEVKPEMDEAEIERRMEQDDSSREGREEIALNYASMRFRDTTSQLVQQVQLMFRADDDRKRSEGGGGSSEGGGGSSEGGGSSSEGGGGSVGGGTQARGDNVAPDGGKQEDVIWGMLVCGTRVKFLEFRRGNTPQFNSEEFNAKGHYYGGTEDPFGLNVPVHTSDSINLLEAKENGDGYRISDGMLEYFGRIVDTAVAHADRLYPRRAVPSAP